MVSVFKQRIEAICSCFFCRRLIHGGQFLNGLAGPTIMSAGPFLSTTWFAPDQRATATAVASLFSYLGGAASFLVGPQAVPAPNDTQAGMKMAAAVSISSIRESIQLVMYAGTYSKQEPLRPWRVDSTSFWSCQHYQGTQIQSGQGIEECIHKTPIKIFITATLKNRLLGLSCLTDAEH